jgi:hypothetical protein
METVSLEEAKERILENLPAELLLEDLMDEDIVKSHMVTNPHAIKEGRFHIDIDHSNAKNIKVVCPFHSTQNDGSASINVKTNALKCYITSCAAHRSMNPIDLYMVLVLGVPSESLLDSKDEFKQALVDLGLRIGVQVDVNTRKLSLAELKELKTIEIRGVAAEIYHKAYAEHPEAEAYLAIERGFQYGIVPLSELVARFKIGFAPNSFGANWLYLQLMGTYSDEELINSGVVYRYQSKDKQTKKTFGKPKVVDKFTMGMILPYFSKERINNLYNRKFTDVKQYRHMRLNGSVDIPIHFDVAKNYESVIFVEGEFSWLSLIAMGFEYAMGNRGVNGFTDEHVKMLNNVRLKTQNTRCKRIYLCYDPDKAGYDAVKSNGEMLRKAGFEDIRVIRLTDGDPNEFLQLHKEHASALFQKQIDEALSYEAFMVLYTLENMSLQSNADKQAALKKARPYIRGIEQDERILIVLEVCEKLKIDSRWLMRAWVGTEFEEEVPGLDEIHQFDWAFIVDDPKLFDAFSENQGLQNVVCVSETNVKKVAEHIAKYPHIGSIVVNEKMDAQFVECLQSLLPERKFLKFSQILTNDQIKVVNKNEFFSYLRVS